VCRRHLKQILGADWRPLWLGGKNCSVVLEAECTRRGKPLRSAGTLNFECTWEFGAERFQ
jgi:hypothetical protein